MGLENYEEELERIESSLERHFSRSQAYRVKVALDNVMPFVLLLIGFVLVFEFFLSVTSRMQVWINRANWALIVYFGSRLVVSYRLSRDHDQFMHRHWLDIMLVIPIFSLMQEIRFAKMFPALKDMPVFERGVLHIAKTKPAAENAVKLTRITRIIKKSV